MDIDKLKDLMGRVTPGPWVQSTMFGPTNVCSEVDRNIRSVAACGGYQRSGPLAETVSVENRANADLIAMAPDLAAEVIRLTAERDQAVAALQAMTAENARLVKHSEALRAIADLTEISGAEFERRHSGLNYILDVAGFDNWGRVISAFAGHALLAGKGKV